MSNLIWIIGIISILATIIACILDMIFVADVLEPSEHWTNKKAEKITKVLKYIAVICISMVFLTLIINKFLNFL